MTSVTRVIGRFKGGYDQIAAHCFELGKAYHVDNIDPQAYKKVAKLRGEALHAAARFCLENGADEACAADLPPDAEALRRWVRANNVTVFGVETKHRHDETGFIASPDALFRKNHINYVAEFKFGSSVDANSFLQLSAYWQVISRMHKDETWLAVLLHVHQQQVHARWFELKELVLGFEAFASLRYAYGSVLLAEKAFASTSVVVG